MYLFCFPLLLLLLLKRNHLQGGMVYSNAVTTVSPTYANEVLNGGAAGWLRSTLMRPEVKSKVGMRHVITCYITCKKMSNVKHKDCAANLCCLMPDCAVIAAPALAVI
jgi:hypothetical protein